MSPAPARPRPPRRSAVAALRAANPEAAELAQLASLATRIEPELLRALRLALLPGADAAAEADLWWSRIVEVRSAAALSLAQTALVELRGQLTDLARLRAAYRVIRNVHRGAAPLLRLEELLTFRTLQPSCRAAEVDRLLRPVLAAMLAQPERRPALAGWAMRALPRLPERARQAQSFWLLLFATNAQPRGAPAAIETPPPAEALAAFLPAVLAGAPDAEVELRWKGGALGLRRAAPGARATVRLPDVPPLLAEISSALPARIALVGDDWSEVEVSGSKVTIGTLDGRSYEVTPSAPSASVSQTAAPGSIESLRRACALMKLEGRQMGAGSGYLVRPRWIATAAHVAVTERASIWIDEAWFKATLLRRDDENDCAIYELDTEVLGVEPLRLRASPVTGRWQTFGYPGDLEGRAMMLSGDILQAPGDTPGKLRFHIDQPFHDRALAGLSGAPIVTGGEVAGQLSGWLSGEHMDRGEGYGCTAGPLIELMRILDSLRGLADLGDEYESIRRREPASHERTIALTDVRRRGTAWVMESPPLPAADLVRMFQTGRPGPRLMALAALMAQPDPAGLDILVEAIDDRRSAFEQYTALQAAEAMLGGLAQPDLVRLQATLRNEQNGPSPTIDGGDGDLLALARRVEQSLSRRLPPAEPGLRLVIVFADKDRAAVEELEMHLTPLRRSGLVQVWHRGMLRPGELLSLAEERLRQADVVVLLVSADLLASQIVLSVKETARVVPVRLRAAVWPEELKRLQALPRGGKAIFQYADRDEAWLEVVSALGDVLKKMSPKRAE